VRINRNLHGVLIAGALLAGSAAAAEVPATQPAPETQPSVQQPATFTVQGQVSIAAGFDLRGPDLSRVVLYLASDPVLDAMPLPAERPAVAQRNKSFVPNFLVVPRMTMVEFPNWDHFDHNVFSRSKAAPAFDLDRYPYGQSKTRQFDKVGVVQVFCNIHPSMRAMIVVTPNKFFARADAEGRFKITGVPAGRYELVAWQERCGEQRTAIRVGPDSAQPINVVLTENRASILANDPPERHGGYGVDRGLGVKRERLDLPVVKDAHPAPKPND
jgi:plastocyanin